MSQPTLTREGIATALFSLLQGITGLNTCSRRLQHWSEVPTDQQPALFLTQGDQVPTQDDSGLPVTWKYRYTVVIYAYNENDQAVPATTINALLDQVEAALLPSVVGPPGFPGSMQVLGDTTQRIRHAWISGPIQTDEGVLGPQAFAFVPVEIELA